MSNEDENYDLVMPFVLVQSAGGPHEDEAFASGWRLSNIEFKLRLASAMSLLPEVIAAKPIEQQQIELLGMLYGFDVQHHEYDEEWSLFAFTKTGSVDSILDDLNNEED